MISNVSGVNFSSQDLTTVRQNRFQKLDQNGDSKITKDEMSASRPQDGKGPSVDDIFSKVDTNQDGAIDEAEDEAALEQMQQQRGAKGAGGPPPDAAKLAEELFKTTDTDTDGKITLDELTAALKQSEESDSTSAAKIFEEADTDKDGAITQTELQAYLKANEPAQPENQRYNRVGDTSQTAMESMFSATA